MPPMRPGVRHHAVETLSNFCCIATLCSMLPANALAEAEEASRRSWTNHVRRPHARVASARRRHPQTVGERDRHLSRSPVAPRPDRAGEAVSAARVGCSSSTTTSRSRSASTAVIHGFFVDGMLRGIAELRPLGPGFPEEAEAAFSIEKPWQSHGVGTALLDRTLLAARNRGIKLLHMACLANNQRMHRSRAQVRGRAHVRFRQRGRRGRGAASDPDVGAARIRRRHDTASPPPCSTCRRRCCGRLAVPLACECGSRPVPISEQSGPALRDHARA